MVQTPFDAQNNTQNHRLSELILKLQPEVAFLALAVPIFLWISWSSLYFQFPTTGYWRDIWEHAAAIKEWMKNLWHPGNPHLPIDTTSPRYMPYFFVLVLLGKAFNLTALQALGIGGIINIAMLLAGIFLFTREYFQNRWAPVVGLMVFLGGWGMGWVYTSNYQLRSLFYVISYPSLFATGFTLILLWYALKILRQPRIQTKQYLIFAGGVAAVFISHPLTGAFAAATLCLLLFCEFSSPVGARSKIIATVVIAVLAVELWPYFSVWDLLLNTSSSAWSSKASTQSSWIVQTIQTPRLIVGKFHDPKVFLVTLGPALLGVPALIYLGFKKTYHFITLGFLIMALPYYGSIFISIPLGQRFLYYMIFFMHLSLIWVILQSGPCWKRLLSSNPSDAKSRTIVIATGSALSISLGFNFVLAVMMFAGYHVRLNMDKPYNYKPPSRYTFIQPVVDDMQHIAQFIPNDAVVLAVPWHAWPLPTFKGKVTALLNPNPFVQDGGKRYSDSVDFFTKDISWENRLVILRRYSVSHLLLRADSLPQKIFSDLQRFGTVIGVVKGYRVLVLDTAIISGQGPALTNDKST